MNKKYSKKKLKNRKNKTFRNVQGGDIAIDLIEYKIKENCPNEENDIKIQKIKEIEEKLKNSGPMFSDKFKKQLKNSLKSLRNISSSPKYVFSLLANPANVHRILFKNAYFIEFINFEHILKLYCGKPKKIYSDKELPEECVVLKKGYLFSKDEDIITNAETEKETEQTSDNKAIEEVLNSGDEIKANENEEKFDMKKFIDEGFERLDFSKLNNALLTDDLKKHYKNNDYQYILFYPQYICLFEYLHSFKYQFHRMLWSGGMFDWTYILDQTKELLDNNDYLHREFRKYNGLEKHDKYLGKFQEIYNNGGKIVQSVIDKDGRINETKINNVVDNLDVDIEIERPKKGGDLKNSIFNSVRKLGSKTGEFVNSVNSVGSKTGKNVNKYMIMRKLLQYYDIDPKKYNMNLLKTTGILKKNYPLFMEREARIALKTANVCLTVNNQSNEYIQDRYNEISGIITNDILDDNEYSLDVLIDEILKIKIRGGYPMKNKTRKSYKGGLVFTRVLNNIFKTCSRLMIKKQLESIEYLMNTEPKETIPVAKFISDLMACAMNSGNILCFTISNFGLMPFLPAGTPHCILSNIAAILILDKLDYLGRRDIIKTGKFDINNTKEQGLETDDESVQDSESEIDTPNISTKSNTSDISIKSNEPSIESMVQRLKNLQNRK